MNIQATLAKCRAELKRQQEMEAKQPVLYTHSSAWREGEPGREEYKADVFRQDKAGHVVAEFYGDWQEVKDNSEYYIEVSGHNPARLKAAEDKLEYAQERLDELNADMAALCELSAHRPYCQEDIPAKDFNEMYDGEEQLQDAIALLGVEVVE